MRRSMVIYDPENASMYVARGADCGSSLVAIEGKMPDGVVGMCNTEAPDSPPEDEQPLGPDIIFPEDNDVGVIFPEEK